MFTVLNTNSNNNTNQDAQKQVKDWYKLEQKMNTNREAMSIK